MRKLVAGLAVSTLAFAGTTIYFWRELAVERARNVVPPAVAAPAPAVGGARVSPEPAIAKAAVATAVPAQKPLTPEQESAQAMIESRRMFAAEAPAFLARLANAQSRADLIAERKAMRRTFTQGLQRYLGMSNEEFDRLQEAMVELELLDQETEYRCALDENCRFPGLDRTSYETRRRDALSPFGPEVADKLDYFERSSGQRRVVEQFRGRLDDAQRLSDAQSEKLVRALTDELDGIRQDMQRLQASGMSEIGGLAFFDAPPDAGQPPRADLSEEAAAYNRRLHDAAARILNAAQLASFDQMQAELVEQTQIWSRRRRDQNSGTPD